MNIGPTELILVLVIALIVFGPRKLPELGKSLGQAMAQFRRASDDFKRSWEQEVEIEKSRLSEIKNEIEKPATDHSYSYDTESAGHTAEAASVPEPATATVARSADSKPSEHWI